MRIRLLVLFALVYALLGLGVRGDTTVPFGHEEQLVVEQTNQQRALEHLDPLRSVPRLAECARLHSQEMAEKDYFSHTSPTDGLVTPRDRVSALGLKPTIVGENIYMSSGREASAVVQSSMDAWMKSPGHRANILKPEFTSIGVGFFVKGADVYVTQVFSTDVSE